MKGRDALAPETEYRVVRSDSPVDVDGFKIGEPTGEIMCEVCHRSAKNIDEIPHAQDCSQRWARTDYWRKRFNGQ